MNNDFLPDRDGVWERFKESAKDTYNAQEIGWLQPMFFEAEFDYGNEKVRQALFEPSF